MTGFAEHQRELDEAERRGRAAWPLAFVIGALCGIAAMGFYIVVVLA